MVKRVIRLGIQRCALRLEKLSLIPPRNMDFCYGESGIAPTFEEEI